MMKLSLRKHDDGMLSHPKLNDEPITVRQGIRLQKLNRTSKHEPAYRLYVDEDTETEHAIDVDKLFYRRRARLYRNGHEQPQGIQVERAAEPDFGEPVNDDDELETMRHADRIEALERQIEQVVQQRVLGGARD